MAILGPTVAAVDCCGGGKDTPDGKMMLIAREARLGGGTIVVSAREAGEPDSAFHLTYEPGRLLRLRETANRFPRSVCGPGRL
jgi:hypothetical protein